MLTERRLNTRVLVIDDEAAVRDSFRTALRARPQRDASLSNAARVLFDEEPAPAASSQQTILFELDVAEDGYVGVEMARAALESGRPYAVIFCDMRMPGLDGVETIERIRAFDCCAEVVFVTAYSDHSVEAIVERTGANVGYFIKPFLSDEMRQVATKLVVEWNKAREIEALVRAVAALRGEPGDIRQLIEHLLCEICLWLDTDSAAILRTTASGEFAFALGVGSLSDGSAVRAVTDRLNGEIPRTLATREGVHIEPVDDGTFLLPIHKYGFAIALSGRARITPDRRYLLEVFLENAALALRNCEIAARLGEAERLAGAGRALGFVLHDVRNPIGAAQMMVQVMKTLPSVTPEVLKGLNGVEFELHRAVDLVRDTLALCSGRLDVRPKALDARNILTDESASWRVQLTLRGVRVRTDAEPGIALYADSARLSRALYNLTKNAADAIVGRDGGFVEVGARAVEGGVEVWVNDNGDGVPEAVLPELFRPFATMGKEDGTGFGLAIVRQVVEAHGGRVDYQREAGLSRFTMFFPDAGA